MSTINSTFNRDNDDHPGPGDMSVDGSLIDKESPPPYITFRKGASQSIESDLARQFKSFQDNMLSMMEAWFAKHDAKFSKVLEQLEDVKTSIKFVSDKYDDLKKSTQSLESRVQLLEHNAQTYVSQIATLESKLDSIEQRARNCNIELSNLPEKKGENLIAITEQIARIIKIPITPHDIIAVHRVRQSNPSNPRPRNIIVKFSSQIIRDNFISAVRLNKGITTEQIQVQGSSQKIYINEHLTLKKKILFRQARETAKENRYRYTWVKQGVILVRADDGTAVIDIHSDKDLSKLKPYSKQN